MKGTFVRKYVVTIIMSLIFALFHVLTIVSTLITTGGSGEGQALAVLFLDFPLVLLLQVIPGGGYILYYSLTAYILFFSIVGAIMYAVVGGMFGLVVDKIRGRKKSSPN